MSPNFKTIQSWLGVEVKIFNNWKKDKKQKLFFQNVLAFNFIIN